MTLPGHPRKYRPRQFSRYQSNVVGRAIFRAHSFAANCRSMPSSARELNRRCPSLLDSSSNALERRLSLQGVFTELQHTSSSCIVNSVCRMSGSCSKPVVVTVMIPLRTLTCFFSPTSWPIGRFDLERASKHLTEPLKIFSIANTHKVITVLARASLDGRKCTWNFWPSRNFDSTNSCVCRVPHMDMLSSPHWGSSPGSKSSGQISTKVGLRLGAKEACAAPVAHHELPSSTGFFLFCLPLTNIRNSSSGGVALCPR